MKHEIGQSEYWQIVGLLALAKTAMDRLKDIDLSIRSVLHVTEEDEETSGISNPEHITDAIYSEYSVLELLEKLGVEVSEGATIRAKA